MIGFRTRQRPAITCALFAFVSLPSSALGVLSPQHADSNGDLFPPSGLLHPTSSSCTLAARMTEAEESDLEEGEGDFSLAEEPVAASLSITEEILELLSQRGLDKDVGTEGAPSREERREATAQVTWERRAVKRWGRSRTQAGARHET